MHELIDKISEIWEAMVLDEMENNSDVSYYCGEQIMENVSAFFKESRFSNLLFALNSLDCFVTIEDLEQVDLDSIADSVYEHWDVANYKGG
jgi:hypothetical protein